MASPIHCEIRSADPDATRKFFTQLLGWEYPEEGAFPGYTFVDTGDKDGVPTAISPIQSGEDQVLFFIGVEDVKATLAKAEELGGKIVQEAQEVPGVTFGVFADAQGHQIGLASGG
jgi:predicted enzyme related to lactoylglutathione lyase